MFHKDGVYGRRNENIQSVRNDLVCIRNHNRIFMRMVTYAFIESQKSSIKQVVLITHPDHTGDATNSNVLQTKDICKWYINVQNTVISSVSVVLPGCLFLVSILYGQVFVCGVDAQHFIAFHP